jgi:hypothetical protein
MGSRLIFLHHYGMFLQEGRRRVADPAWWNGRFKPVGGPLGGFVPQTMVINTERRRGERSALMNSVIPGFQEKLR